jgi:hypothetical protein
VSRLFDRPLYDYREVWSRFTETTSSLYTTRELCHAIVRMVSETLNCLAVSLWLVDEGRDALVFGASTDLTEENGRCMRIAGREGAELIMALLDQDMPIDFLNAGDGWAADFRRTHTEALEEAGIDHAAPLRAANRLVGVLTLRGRSSKVPLNTEDHELLRTIADQSASSLLNLRLADQLNKAKALEALQMMSAFFMHDLKNLGSKLSLVTQNLPVHFDNPEFRKDAIQSITQSVAKINGMCNRLSLLSERIEIHPREVSLDHLVEDGLKSLDGIVKVPVHCSLGQLTGLNVDGDQIQKVIANLLLNANDAVSGGGQIDVSTSRHDDWAVLVVRDTGCGMSREFIETRLFRPFQTTKPKGMGVGLFHCKTIVEAHGGRIEVASEEGKGSTFSVFLPARR